MTNKILSITHWITLSLFVFLTGLSFFSYVIPSFLLFVFLFLVLCLAIYHSIKKSLSLYVLKRLFESFISILAITTITFFMLRLLPGGPFDRDKKLPEQIKRNIEAKYGLDQSLGLQYFNYLKKISQGDLGLSYKYLDQTVSEIITKSFPISFQLGLYALILSFLIGIPLGLLSAFYHNSWKDHLMMFFAISGVSLPSFALAALLIIFFSFYLSILPSAFWQGTSYYILPSIVLGIRPASIIARLVRSSVLEVIRLDYIRTAKSKGLSASKILTKHVLKNSLIPVLTFSGPLIASILSGSFIVELIFNIPGIGKHLIESVTNRDYPLVLASTLVFCCLLILCNLIVDLLYSYLDPRIKLQ